MLMKNFRRCKFPLTGKLAPANQRLHYRNFPWRLCDGRPSPLYHMHQQIALFCRFSWSILTEFIQLRYFVIVTFISCSARLYDDLSLNGEKNHCLWNMTCIDGNFYLHRCFMPSWKVSCLKFLFSLIFRLYWQKIFACIMVFHWARRHQI